MPSSQKNSEIKEKFTSNDKLLPCEEGKWFRWDRIIKTVEINDNQHENLMQMCIDT